MCCRLLVLQSSSHVLQHGRWQRRHGHGCNGDLLSCCALHQLHHERMRLLLHLVRLLRLLRRGRWASGIAALLLVGGSITLSWLLLSLALVLLLRPQQGRWLPLQHWDSSLPHQSCLLMSLHAAGLAALPLQQLVSLTAAAAAIHAAARAGSSHIGLHCRRVWWLDSALPCIRRQCCRCCCRWLLLHGRDCAVACRRLIATWRRRNAGRDTAAAPG